MNTSMARLLDQGFTVAERGGSHQLISRMPWRNHGICCSQGNRWRTSKGAGLLNDWGRNVDSEI